MKLHLSSVEKKDYIGNSLMIIKKEDFVLYKDIN